MLDYLNTLFLKAGGTDTDRIGIVLNLPGTTTDPESKPSSVLGAGAVHGVSDRDFRRMAARR